MHDLVLAVNGIEYGGWTRQRVHRGMEEISGKFDIDVTELWPNQGTVRDINTGDACSVRIDGANVVTGFVDRVRLSYNNDNHTVAISGRDATGDLVDCSAIHKTGEWTNAKLDQIARDLCAPFGMKVLIQTDIGPVFPKWAIQEGETVYECLERAARARGVLLLSDGNGALVIARPSKVSTGVIIERGVNILEARAENSQNDRFSQYIIKGQRAGSDHASGEPVVAQKASATDPGVTRYRPLVVILEDQGEIATFTDRAKFEATVRAARALSANVSVQGWTHPGGLWQPNQMVHLRDPWLGIDRDLLIKEVDLVIDEQGTRAELCLTIPEAYSLSTMPPAPKKARGKNRRHDKIESFLGVGR